MTIKKNFFNFCFIWWNLLLLRCFLYYMKSSVTTLFSIMQFLFFEYLIVQKQYAITLTAGDTELKGSQKIPLVELCFKFFLHSRLAYIFTGILRYVGFCLVYLIPFHFVSFAPSPPPSLYIQKEETWDLVLSTAVKQYWHMKTHDSIFYQKLCFLLWKLIVMDFITNAFYYVSVSQAWLFFPVIISLACASVIIGNCNKIILTTCEIWSSNCQYEIYCPLRWYILYYGKHLATFQTNLLPLFSTLNM